jgi:hypothetical protein
MNILQNEPTVPSLQVDSTTIRWDGHMSDGVGATYGPKPLAWLSAASDHLVLSGNRGTFRIPRAAIVKLGRGRMYPWCFSGVRIQHRVANFPEELQFKPIEGTSREILDRLRALGFPVA